LLKNKWYEFKFEKPIFCKRIVYRSHNKEISGLKTVCFDGFGREKEIKISNKDSGNIRIEVDMVIVGFKIKAPLRMSEKINLKSILIYGYHEDDFKEVENELRQYLEIKDNIEEKSRELEEQRGRVETLVKVKGVEVSQLDAKIKSLNEELAGVEDEVEELSEKRKDLETKLGVATTGLSEVNKKVESANNNVDQLRQQAKELNEQISIASSELLKLERNKNLFAYEVEDYIKQGNRNIQSYTLLAFLPWLLIAYIAWYLFNGAVDLTSFYRKESGSDILDILLSRLPFVMVAGAIVIVSYEISKIFVSKILEINAQKLRFSEIGIIAKDTSYASEEGLELDDDELHELRTKLKMDLLRHHMKKLDPETFEYEINPSIWGKYKNVILDKFNNGDGKNDASNNQKGQTRSN
jgi:hypothetical protein